MDLTGSKVTVRTLTETKITCTAEEKVGVQLRVCGYFSAVWFLKFNSPHRPLIYSPRPLTGPPLVLLPVAPPRPYYRVCEQH